MHLFPGETEESRLLYLQEKYSWVSLVKEVQESVKYTDLDKRKIKHAFKVMEDVFGSEFPIEVMKNEHRLSQYLINRAAWTRHWFIWFSEMIKNIRSKIDDTNIFIEYKNPANAKEKFEVIRNTHRFIKAGFNVTIEPEIEIEGTMKKPDLRLRNNDNDDEIVIEISEVAVADQQKEAQKPSDTIMDFIMRNLDVYPLHYGGRLNKVLSENTTNEIIKVLEEKIEKLKSSEIFQCIDNEEITIGMSMHGEKEYEEWMRMNSLRTGSFSSPLGDVNEIYRIKRKMKEKQKQLPKNVQSILIIYPHSTFGWNMADVVAKLEEEVYKYDNLLFLAIVSSGWNEPDTSTTYKGEHRFYSQNTSLHCSESVYLFYNKYNNLPTTPNTMRKIQDAFREH
ncbi:MAG: hypothetical protein ABUK01_06350 [Leptospirales bacterium]